MNSEFIQILSDGKVFFDYGPVSMVISAFDHKKPLTDLCVSAFEVIEITLKELSISLDILKQKPSLINPHCLEGLSRKMYDAVIITKNPDLTPMATIAGIMSDKVADWIYERGGKKVIVNNGGDIALRLSDGESVTVGVLSDLNTNNIDATLTISSEDTIGGIATSGLGGRSFTQGIANAVTILAKTCTQADALATHIANKSYVSSKNVVTVKAGNIDPDSDIKDLEVVVSVSQLSHKEISMALEQMKEESKYQLELGNLYGVLANVQDKYLCYPKEYFINKLKGDKDYEC
ncbi:ApbE family lipoprotein [Clostridium sp. DL-VIII]|uniref:FAD:protein FMN transferase n=1 Tax=Clostridium sp. DL-VIII TaxID=641107 RepID=UPI00023AF2D3|nr:FAD:protein FMN transferase [Clostridium sp. DL-VIII]EHI97716.1 ApbE family lipoprotein [Clostridium sp. DL-VIII]